MKMLEDLAEAVPGELDRTAPAVIWLQIDNTGDNDDRSEPWPGTDGVTWQDESIGGQEIQYVRADIYLDLAKRLEECEQECREEARLNGMGSEREAALMARLEAAEKDAALWRAIESKREEGVKYGCHVDLDPGMEPDGCVIDEGEPHMCMYAKNIACKELCPYWRKVVPADQAMQEAGR